MAAVEADMASVAAAGALAAEEEAHRHHQQHAQARPSKDAGTNTDAQDDEASAFECNICLSLSREPVVTLCGHLYCWPCLYRCVVCAREERGKEPRTSTRRDGSRPSPAPPRAQPTPHDALSTMQVDAGAELHARVPRVQGRRRGRQGASAFFFWGRVLCPPLSL
jgi:hypothetical protein